MAFQDVDNFEKDMNEILEKRGTSINVSRIYIFLNEIKDMIIQGKESFLMVMVDITERDSLVKSVEDKLQKLTNVIDGTNLGTWELNIPTKKLEVNKHLASMLGYSLDGIDVFNAEQINENINSEELGLSNEIIKKHLSGELDCYDVEMRMKHKYGRWVLTHGGILRDEKGCY